MFAVTKKRENRREHAFQDSIVTNIFTGVRSVDCKSVSQRILRTRTCKMFLLRGSFTMLLEIQNCIDRSRSKQASDLDHVAVKASSKRRGGTFLVP